MGLDIFLRTDLGEKLTIIEDQDPDTDYFNLHSLSRTFCNFMCRKNMEGEPELDQIGRITSIDISPIYEMETYGESYELSFYLERAESEEEKQQLIEEDRQRKENLKGNIDKVMATINALINKLSAIDNLPALLNDNGHDTLSHEFYFADFSVDKGEGYIDNNFGQDLRNFQRFLEFAKKHGATTVYFLYG